MKNLLYPLFICGLLFSLGCKKPNPVSNNQNVKDSLNAPSDSLVTHVDSLSNPKDTLADNDTLKTQKPNVKDWKVEDFIIKSKDKKSESVRRTLESKMQTWKNVKYPLIAKYVGSDFGDYFHLNFEDANGTQYDFGFGNNEFGKFKLYNEKTGEDNPKYLGKSFKIYWNWKKTSFPCCDGDYDLIQAYMPSISQLELME
jgi:hypothetical protein